MARVPLNIIGEAYADETLPFAAQETINAYPVLAETGGTRSVIALKGTPGLRSWGTVGTGTVRGNITMAGTAYFVADTALYSTTSSGTSTSLGTIEGSQRVGIAENGVQLLVVNGTKGWFYNRNTAAFGEVTDVDFPEADDCCFIGNYVACVDQDTDQWFISALSDVTNYDALDFASAETDTDGLLGILPLQQDVWLFGERSIEVWRNTGAADFPFERVTTIERGLAATFAKAKLDNTIYWLGENGIVYKAQGYSPVRVSKRPIEQAIAQEDLSEAFALAYEESGHAFFILTFPNGKTWVYDVASNMWHRRKSFEMERWRGNTYLFAYSKHLVGDTTQGIVWEMTRDVYTEGSDPLVWERKGQTISDPAGGYIRGAEIELGWDMGQGLATGQGSNPLIDFSYSDDGGRTFCDWRQVSAGTMADYQARARIHGLGRFRSRIPWLRYSEPTKRDLIWAAARGAD